MKIQVIAQDVKAVREDVLALGVHSGGPKGTPLWSRHDAFKLIDAAMQGALTQTAKDEDFSGKRGETLRFTKPAGLGVKKLVVIGLGPEAKGSAVARISRYLGVKAADNAQKYRSLAVVAPSLDKSEEKTESMLRALAEGLTMGAYDYTEYKTEPKSKARKLQSIGVLLGKNVPQTAKDSIERGRVVAELVNSARDMVNCPPNDMHPRELARCAATMSKQLGIQCKVFDKKEIEKRGMKLLLAVNSGSGEEPRFIHMAYKPRNKKAPKVVFVGKGLTFDSGGLCIKPSKSMMDMKCDMAGGAVTIAIVAAAAKLKLDVEVHGVIPSTENMTGDFAFRPGDVYTSLDGKTVEIINTDAEGRLILADAFAYARELKPDVMVDHATLTGACMVALGQYRAGIFSTRDAYLDQYLEASETSGENYWNLPLDEDLRDALKSDVADLKHTGETYGGTITAALFLREFTGDVPWVHVDFAGPAFLDRAKGTMPKGATGFGVLTAIRFLEKFQANT